MPLLVKNIKNRAQYQQWQAVDITNGDILGVLESLGRPACSVTIESLGGSSTIRFNVSKKIYKEHNELHNSWVGLGQGTLRSSPVLLDEIELNNPNIVVEADNVQTWAASEICVHDIKVVSKSSGLKITVA